ncbi:FGGY-family carbohydrate kinase [Compostibacter hankyongensis]|uniref:FGGY-family carbohydrate kinase n=1 Tax=Compostibacter hankyongensis TaxID=1007089 RepID=A0ABP8FUN2_9BACT
MDIGTQGARVVLTDAEGKVAGSREEAFPLNAGSREEQSPRHWWEASLRCLEALVAEVKGHVNLQDIRALAVTSTSGTVIPLDAQHEPLHPAIMYSDKRSVQEAQICRSMAERYHPDGYTGFNTSSGLPKMLWWQNAHPETVPRLRSWAHAADYITGRISGRWGITDYTNALKSGYDLRRLEWPAYLWEQLPLQRSWLPEVVPSGTPVGTIDAALAAHLGLPGTLTVTAGVTDGCASQMASGAVSPGDWNTTIGTTLVIKGVTRKEIRDPEGVWYSHRHPDGYWMPGGASNTGADWISTGFGNKLPSAEELAGVTLPTGELAYPLQQEGERFPFQAPSAKGFFPESLSPLLHFVAGMEGVAYLERYAYERVAALSGEAVKAVYTAGGGSNSPVWLQIRSQVLNLPLYKMEQVSGAAGGAILAASRTHFGSLQEAAKAMTRVEKVIRPEPGPAEAYDKNYRRFVKRLQEKGYIH